MFLTARGACKLLTSGETTNAFVIFIFLFSVCVCVRAHELMRVCVFKLLAPFCSSKRQMGPHLQKTICLKPLPQADRVNS